MKTSSADQRVSPFDWRHFTARAAAPAAQPPERAAKPPRPVSAAERAARVLAHRWGNPYCKPGMP